MEKAMIWSKLTAWPITVNSPILKNLKLLFVPKKKKKTDIASLIDNKTTLISSRLFPQIDFKTDMEGGRKGGVLINLCRSPV
jgi:hypothetical protein